MKKLSLLAFVFISFASCANHDRYYDINKTDLTDPPACIIVAQHKGTGGNFFTQEYPTVGKWKYCRVDK